MIRKKYKKVAFFATFFFIVGCGVEQRIDKAYNLALMYNFAITPVKTKSFSLQTFVKNEQSAHAIIYLEGDGLVVSQGHVAFNPTPTDPMALRLAVVDNRPYTKIVINRPCQYITDDKCNKVFWTQGRYNQKVIDAIAETIQMIQKKYHFKTFEIVAYSGGAAVAFLVVPYFVKDITRIITFAGNVDPFAWTDFHEVMPLTESLNPLDNIGILRQIPQIHFSGTSDDNTTLAITENFQRKLNAHGIKVISIEGFSHDSNWPNIWEEHLRNYSSELR